MQSAVITEQGRSPEKRKILFRELCRKLFLQICFHSVVICFASVPSVFMCRDILFLSFFSVKEAVVPRGRNKTSHRLFLIFFF